MFKLGICSLSLVNDSSDVPLKVIFPPAAPVTFLTCVSTTLGQGEKWSLRTQPGLTDMTVNSFLDLLGLYAL